MMNFDDKYAGETEYVGWDFAARLETGETIVSATFAVTDPAGVDPSPSGILHGSAVVASPVARHMVKNLVVGARYVIVTTAQTSGSRELIEVGVLRVRGAGE